MLNEVLNRKKSRAHFNAIFRSDGKETNPME